MNSWTLLLALLPESDGFAIDSHSPRFSDWKPKAQPEVSPEEYWQVARAIFEMCLERLEEEPALWVDMVPRLDDLPRGYRLEVYGSLERLEGRLEPAEQNMIWGAMDRLWRRHKEYSDSDWALPEEEIGQLVAISTVLAPVDPVARLSWLFDAGMPDLGVGKDSLDYEASLRDAQRSALVEINEQLGLSGVLSLAAKANSPEHVGYAFAWLETDTEPFVVAVHLGDSTGKLHRFAMAYLSTVLADNFGSIRDLNERFQTMPLVQARLLLLSADVQAAWAEVERLGGDAERTYWQEFYPYGRGPDYPLANETARQLGRHGRPAMALDVLSHFRRGPVALESGLIVDLFAQLLEEGDPQMGVLSRYEIGELMAYLRSSEELPEDTLGHLEWQLLPALKSDPSSSTLQRRLANSPDFFVEVLSLVYRGKHDADREPSDKDRSFANNAWRLLNDWKVVPGSDPETKAIDASSLIAWTQTVREKLVECDRVDVGELQIGQVLARSGTDADGSWPPRVVRDFFESQSTEKMLSGFRMGTYNKRGVTSRGMTDGGSQEYRLAARFQAWADAASAWPKTARVLRDLAEGYKAEGHANDEESQRIQEGFGI